MTNDGQYVYATFDGGVTGTGGAAVVNVLYAESRERLGLPGSRPAPRDLVFPQEGPAVTTTVPGPRARGEATPDRVAT